MKTQKYSVSRIQNQNIGETESKSESERERVRKRERERERERNNFWRVFICLPDHTIQKATNMYWASAQTGFRALQNV